jgi:AraC family cel operon transcriptional repressor
MNDIYLLNDTMTSPNINLWAKITDDCTDTCYHQHAFYEIFYILEGSIIHVCNDIEETLEYGDIIFLKLNDKHKFIHLENTLCRHRDIIITSNQYLFSCDYISNNLFNDLSSLNKPFKAKLSSEQINNFEKNILQIMNIQNTDYLIKKSLINILLIDLLGIYMKSKLLEKNNRQLAWFETLLSRFNVLEFIKEGIPKIIEPIHYDKSYICRTFKRYIGITMSEYLNNARLNYAANLLKYTDNNILFICNECGYKSLSYFFSTFKKKYNISPTAFRKLPIEIQ